RRYDAERRLVVQARLVADADLGIAPLVHVANAPDARAVQLAESALDLGLGQLLAVFQGPGQQRLEHALHVLVGLFPLLDFPPTIVNPAFDHVFGRIATCLQLLFRDQQLAHHGLLAAIFVYLELEFEPAALLLVHFRLTDRAQTQRAFGRFFP